VQIISNIQNSKYLLSRSFACCYSFEKVAFLKESSAKNFSRMGLCKLYRTAKIQSICFPTFLPAVTFLKKVAFLKESSAKNFSRMGLCKLPCFVKLQDEQNHFLCKSALADAVSFMSSFLSSGWTFASSAALFRFISPHLRHLCTIT